MDGLFRTGVDADLWAIELCDRLPPRLRDVAHCTIREILQSLAKLDVYDWQREQAEIDRAHEAALRRQGVIHGG